MHKFHHISSNLNLAITFATLLVVAGLLYATSNTVPIEQPVRSSMINDPQKLYSTPRSSDKSLYVDPSLQQAHRPAAIATQPVGKWFGGWSGDIRRSVDTYVSAASQSKQIPVLVTYNIPMRDCGNYSAGGAGSSSEYRTWVNAFAAGIGSRESIVIVEPDAIPSADCLSAQDQQQRYDDISFAVAALAKTRATTYIDAGNYSWQSASVMAKRLARANISEARGFSLNVSGYGWTDKTVAYGNKLQAEIDGNKGFVIDTSRNGNGPTSDNQWCNASGRALGAAPTRNTNRNNVDAYLWIKVPGESDGTCNGGPQAGEWWNEAANELVANSN